MKQMIAQLAAHDLLQDIFDGVPIRIFWKDGDGRYLGCNALFARDAGFDSPDDLIGKTDFDLVWRAQAEDYRASELKVMASGAPDLDYEECRPTPKGEMVRLRTSRVLLRNAPQQNVGILGIYEVLTPRRKIGAQLRASETRFRTLVEQSPLATQIIAPDGVTTRVNRAWEELWGVPLEALAGYNLFEDRQLIESGIMPEIRKAFAGEAVLLPELEYDKAATLKLVGPPGKFWVRTYAYPVKTETGELREVVLVHENTTARRCTEQALQESEGRFRDLFENSPDPCWLIDENNLFVMCNQVAAQLLGYASPEELCSVHPSQLSPEVQPDGRDSREKANAMMAIAHQQGVHRFEWEHRRREGSCFPIEVTLARIDIAGAQQLYCVWRDISDRKALEDRLRQSQKMEAIGTLVGGIAHDFNNILAAIQGNIHLARKQLGEQPLAVDKLANVEQLGMRAAEMVQQLLMFARKDRVAMRVFTLNAFLTEGYRLLSTAIPESIDHRLMVCGEEVRIKGDATQLQQVLMNLINNAVDAVVRVPRPKIRCHLSLYQADRAFSKRHAQLSARRFACIKVTDNGQGIPRERLDKIFEPFFTTKAAGKGTGLGLAMLYGAVQTHGGVVEVESALGRGTAFRIYLPLCSEDPDVAAAVQACATRHQEATLLLVDDDNDLRAVTCEVLTSMGYRVFDAGDGEEALKLYWAQAQQIELLITDVVMPKMSGLELVSRVRQLKAGLPVILLTGYDRDHVLEQGVPQRRCRVLNKPCGFDELAQAIQQLTQGETLRAAP